MDKVTKSNFTLKNNSFRDRYKELFNGNEISEIPEGISKDDQTIEWDKNFIKKVSANPNIFGDGNLFCRFDKNNVYIFESFVVSRSSPLRMLLHHDKLIFYAMKLFKCCYNTYPRIHRAIFDCVVCNNTVMNISYYSLHYGRFCEICEKVMRTYATNSIKENGVFYKCPPLRPIRTDGTIAELTDAVIDIDSLQSNLWSGELGCVYIFNRIVIPKDMFLYSKIMNGNGPSRVLATDCGCVGCVSMCVCPFDKKFKCHIGDGNKIRKIKTCGFCKRISLGITVEEWWRKCYYIELYVKLIDISDIIKKLIIKVLC